jgi:hypothetical protein
MLAVDLFFEDVELDLVVGLPARAERDEALVEPHAVLHRGTRLEVVVPVPGDHLDEALALLQRVDDRGAAHAEHAEVGVLLARLEDEALHEPLALGHLGAGVALLRVVDLVDDHEVDHVPLRESDELGLRVGLLELLVVQTR